MLQRHMVETAKATFDQLECFRYTTAQWNVSSCKLGAKCGLSIVHTWGVLLISAHPGENDGEPIFKKLSPAQLLQRLEAQPHGVSRAPSRHLTPSRHPTSQHMFLAWGAPTQHVVFNSLHSGCGSCDRTSKSRLCPPPSTLSCKPLRGAALQPFIPHHQY